MTECPLAALISSYSTMIFILQYHDIHYMNNYEEVSIMVGIVSYGSYVPTLRIDRGLIAGAWGRNSLGGERSVANHDEDSITMAVEASENCLADAGMEREAIGGLFFASTMAPYSEKMSSTLIATVLDLNREIETADFAQSLRAGTGAFKAAINAVASGATANLIVVGSDYRLGYPRSDQEQVFGDGAGAVLVGTQNLLATFEGSYSISNEMVDVWRNPEDRFVKTWESRFILEEGYTACMVEAVSGIMKKYGLKAGDITHVILPAPDARTHRATAQKLGFDLKTQQVQDPLITNIGHCGTAQPLIMLNAALETAKSGDLFLVATYGDGVDVMLFKATDLIGKPAKRCTLASMLAGKRMIPTYVRFLSYRGILETQPGDPFRLFPSATVSWRERSSSLRCHASRCRKCGIVTFPIQRVCYECRTKDDYDEVRLSGLQGKVFTFSVDNLAGRSDDPSIVQTIVEMANGGRFYGTMTDCDPATVTMDMPVELTFRRIYEGAGFHNYFWKCRPARKGGAA